MKSFLFGLVLVMLLGSATCLRCASCRGPLGGACTHGMFFYPPYTECGATGAVCAAIVLETTDNLLTHSTLQVQFHFGSPDKIMIFKGCAADTYCTDHNDMWYQQSLGIKTLACETCKNDICNLNSTYSHLQNSHNNNDKLSSLAQWLLILEIVCYVITYFCN